MQVATKTVYHLFLHGFVFFVNNTKSATKQFNFCMLNSFNEILSMSIMVFLGIWQVLKESWRFTAKKKQRNKKQKNKNQTQSPPPPPPPNNLRLEKSWKIRRKLYFWCIIHNKYMNKGFSIHCTLLIYVRNTSCANLEGEESGRSRTPPPPPGKINFFKFT